ncbi:hypothetical protein BCV72DRAFT_338643 [Rhizopus microsporus var. microsporus]|uniref:DNA mismatch repair protein S5 domain-containing protein n=2 Tax=Rhizopus microsporus TaxID=58291 RepID=A0A2G4ST20_RHIZD|nr:uncharacterized protein RHIMIDRAFT_292467 [Rhizopus microsporus ATCC 52813]ORE02536.1 hypothetical protein BCV72DRAFT_338643 [Rhizopus microsporus var. microsporus]PHZ11536.1 hypothetical protein RHIMIDRAFT_292467 [Rhizopus microsporus ATCC 52813]
MRINQLGPHTINRIAAGERPANVVKEIMENSLDADSNHIHITIVAGGLELIKIKDNGHGIHFRAFTFRSIYKDGKLTCKPTPCASNDGTTVIVQNLFPNTVQRRKSFTFPLEEYKRIQECVENYAMHHYQHGFTLKQVKILEHTKEDFSLKLLYSTIATNSSIEKAKSPIFITVVNNRLIGNAQIKKSLKKVYKDIDENYSPSFLYVSLHVRPDKLDANIHPTKIEVK